MFSMVQETMVVCTMEEDAHFLCEPLLGCAYAEGLGGPTPTCNY